MKKTAAEILEDALNERRKDDLSEHLEVIAILRGKNLTWRDIASFLCDRGVDVDHTRVYRFAKANEEEINRITNGGVNMNKSNQVVVPPAKEYVRALQTIKLTPSQLQMLRAHYMAHNRSITYRELALAAGFDTHVVANSQYGKLGRDLGENIGFAFTKSKTRDAFFYSSAIGADNPDTPEGEEYQLIMHHELAKAIQELGWFKD